MCVYDIYVCVYMYTHKIYCKEAVLGLLQCRIRPGGNSKQIEVETIDRVKEKSCSHCRRQMPDTAQNPPVDYNHMVINRLIEMG